MRLSRLTLNGTPSFSPMACASRIMSAASARVGGKRQMSSSVAWVSALIGLKLRLPHSLSQISARISDSTGVLKPALRNSVARVRTRSVSAPSISPIGKRLPSITRTTPGAASSAAG